MTPYGTKPFEAFVVGDRAEFSKTITDADILLFAGVSGDQYPLHVDAEYARDTRFGQRAAHGLLLQRPGGIFVEQTLHFRKPVFIGDTLTASAEVVEVLTARRRLRARTTIANQRGDVVVEGIAVLQKDER